MMNTLLIFSLVHSATVTFNFKILLYIFWFTRRQSPVTLVFILSRPWHFVALSQDVHSEHWDSALQILKFAC